MVIWAMMHVFINIVALRAKTLGVEPLSKAPAKKGFLNLSSKFEPWTCVHLHAIILTSMHIFINIVVLGIKTATNKGLLSTILTTPGVNTLWITTLPKEEAKESELYSMPEGEIDIDEAHSASERRLRHPLMVTPIPGKPSKSPSFNPPLPTPFLLPTVSHRQPWLTMRNTCAKFKKISGTFN